VPLCVCVCVCACLRVFSSLFRCDSFQVCVTVCMRSVLVWDFTQHWMVVCFQRFWIAYQYHLQRPSILLFKWKILCSVLYCNGLSKLNKTVLSACWTLLGNIKTWISTFASALLGPDIWIVSTYVWLLLNAHYAECDSRDYCLLPATVFFMSPRTNILVLHNAYYAQSHPRFSSG